LPLFFSASPHKFKYNNTAGNKDHAHKKNDEKVTEVHAVVHAAKLRINWRRIATKARKHKIPQKLQDSQRQTL
jgi:hypothetical protein